MKQLHLIFYLTFQFFKFGTAIFCSSSFNNQTVHDIVDVEGFRDWFNESLERVDQDKITNCIDQTLKYSMQLVFCSREIYEKVLNSMQYLFCSEESNKDDTLLCEILSIFRKPEAKKLMPELLRMSNICPPDTNVSKKSSSQRIDKRQFDLASTFDTIGQFFCEEIVDDTFVEAWNDVLATTFKNKYDEPHKDDYNFANKYFLYPFLLRRPCCCLLQRDFHGLNHNIMIHVPHTVPCFLPLLSPNCAPQLKLVL